MNLLLDQDGIDDSLLDANGKSCKDVARGEDVIKAIQGTYSYELYQPLPNTCWMLPSGSDLVSRSFLGASYCSLLRSYIGVIPSQTTQKSPNPNRQNSPKALIDFLSSPRIKHVDLNHIDDQSGTTLLHEAAKRKDLGLLELAIRAGADVFVRDRRGRPVYDATGTGKDDQVRVFLRQCGSLLNRLDFTRLIYCSHEPRYHTACLLIFNSSATNPQRIPAKVYQRREGLQYKMVCPQGRDPLMQVHAFLIYLRLVRL